MTINPNSYTFYLIVTPTLSLFIHLSAIFSSTQFPFNPRMKVKPVAEDVKKCWITSNKIKHQRVSKRVSTNPANCMRLHSLRHTSKCMNVSSSAGKMKNQNLLTSYYSFASVCIHFQIQRDIIVIPRALVCNPNVAKCVV